MADLVVRTAIKGFRHLPSEQLEAIRNAAIEELRFRARVAKCERLFKKDSRRWLKRSQRVMAHLWKRTERPDVVAALCDTVVPGNVHDMRVSTLKLDRCEHCERLERARRDQPPRLPSGPGT